MQKKQIYVVLPNDTAEKVDIVLLNVGIGGKENGQIGSTGENWQGMRFNGKNNKKDFYKKTFMNRRSFT